MKEEMAKKWVEALRSGNFQQGKGRLLMDNKFCCLGVLCEISGEHWYTQGAYLPERIMLETGVQTSHGVIPSHGDSLVCLNDSGKSFSDIADIIERYWKEL